MISSSCVPSEGGHNFQEASTMMVAVSMYSGDRLLFCTKCGDVIPLALPSEPHSPTPDSWTCPECGASAEASSHVRGDDYDLCGDCDRWWKSDGTKMPGGFDPD